MDWITINKTEGRGSAEVKVTAPTYRELVDRITRLKISTLSKTAYVSITQEKFIPIFELSKTKLIFINDVVEENINITSNIEWTATVSNDWITLSSYNGDGNSILTISVNESDTAERTGSVEFYNSGILIGTISITQYDNSLDILYVEPSEIVLTDNLTTTINVTSNREWVAKTDVDWLTITPNEGFAGNEIQLTITAEKDTGLGREATISFYIDDTEKQILNVYQIGVVETPTDIENCFYIEPIDYKRVELTFLYNNVSYQTNVLDRGLYYYHNGKWNFNNVKTGGVYNSLFFYRRIYLKDFTRKMDTAGTYPLYESLKLSGLCNVGGNIETLLGEMRGYYAYDLFGGGSIVDASNLLLPATTLADWCYALMFDGETHLITTPELPATALACGSYYGMFENCKNLEIAPVLPANHLKPYCYKYMFSGCRSLKEVVMLAIDYLDYERFEYFLYWMENVSPTGILYKHPNASSGPPRPSGWEVRDYEGDL